ncbi:MAG: hypothetical protein WBA51_02665 [Erythrobacter sp.]
MTLFSRDLYRQLGLGFLIGAAMVGAVNAEVLSDAFSPPAQAAELPQAPAPSDEFVIAPLD